MYTRTSIKMLEDSANSYPDYLAAEIENNKITLFFDNPDRTIKLSLEDLQTLVKIATLLNESK